MRLVHLFMHIYFHVRVQTMDCTQWCSAGIQTARIVSGCYAHGLTAFCCIAIQNHTYKSYFRPTNEMVFTSLQTRYNNTIRRFESSHFNSNRKSSLYQTRVGTSPMLHGAMMQRDRVSHHFIAISISTTSRWCQSYALVNYNCQTHSTALAIWA